MFKHDSCVTFMCDILSICTVSYNIFTHKVDGPYLVHYFTHTLVFNWWVVRCTSNNGHNKDICLKKIGLHIQNPVNDPRSLVNTTCGRRDLCYLCKARCQWTLIIANNLKISYETL